MNDKKKGLKPFFFKINYYKKWDNQRSSELQ